jgi:hypothetical protein
MRAVEDAVLGHRGDAPGGGRTGHPSEREHQPTLVVAAAVAVGYLAIALPEGGYGSVARAVATVLLWGAVIVGLAFGFWPRAALPRPALIAALALGGLGALTGLSMLWGIDDGRSFQEVIRVAAYLGLFLCVVLATRRGAARAWLTGLGVGLGLVGLLALASVLVPGLFPVADIHEQRPETLARLSFPLGYWNGVGLVTALAVTLLGWTSAIAAGRRARAAAVAALPPLLLALLLTSSRGSMIALGIGLAVLLVADRNRASAGASLAMAIPGTALLLLAARLTPAVTSGAVTRGEDVGQAYILLAVTIAVALGTAALRSRLDDRIQSARPQGSAIWKRPVVLLAAAVVLVAALIAIDPVARLEQFASEPSQVEAGRAVDPEQHLLSASGGGRLQYWRSALGAFAGHPLTGIGAGGFRGWWGEHGTVPLYVQNAHSLPLETLGELGLGGIALLLAFLLTPLVAGLRRLRDQIPDRALAPALAIVAASGFSAAIDWIWELPGAFAPLVIAAGLLAGPALTPAPEAGRSRFGFGLLAILAGWAAILAAAASLFSDFQIAQSQTAFRARDYAGALADARQARALQPWAARPWLQEAFALEGQGDVEGAIAAIDQAILRAPRDWELWYQKGRLLLEVDDLDGYETALFVTVDLRPDIRLGPPPRS